MKTLLYTTALLLVFWMGAPAQADSSSIKVVATFDYPGEGNSTRPQGMNNAGDVVGQFIDPAGVSRGFIRYQDGTFSAPIVAPNDAGGYTYLRDINDRGVACGNYLDPSGRPQGFFLSGGQITDYLAPGAVTTYVGSLNDRGDFAGAYTTPEAYFAIAFASINGHLSGVGLPDDKFSFSVGINNKREVVGFYYEFGNLRPHGFYRAPNGSLLAPIDPPDSIDTFLSGINEQGSIIGRYTDFVGVQHGLAFQPGEPFLFFDFPGATNTSLTGINDRGQVIGRYDDENGVSHGFLGQIKVTR